MRKMKLRKIYMTDEQWERAKRLSEEAGISISEYIRTLLDLKIPKPISSEYWRLMYRELSAIGNNVNQMAKLSHINGSASYSDFRKDLSVIRKIQEEMLSLAKKPWDMTDGGS